MDGNVVFVRDLTLGAFASALGVRRENAPLARHVTAGRHDGSLVERLVADVAHGSVPHRGRRRGGSVFALGRLLRRRLDSRGKLALRRAHQPGGINESVLRVEHKLEARVHPVDARTPLRNGKVEPSHLRLELSERHLGDASVGDATRQARLLAFVRAAISGTPASIEAAVAAIAGSCEVVEVTIEAVMASDPTPDADTPRGVFRFAVVVPLAVASSAPQVAQITAVVDRMKPTHTSFAVTNQATGFLTDDPASLTDLTVLAT